MKTAKDLRAEISALRKHIAKQSETALGLRNELRAMQSRLGECRRERDALRQGFALLKELGQ